MERVARKVPGGEQPTLEGREIYRKRMTSKVKLTFESPSFRIKAKQNLRHSRDGGGWMVFGTNRGWVTGPRAGERLWLLGIRFGLGLRPLDHGLHRDGGLAGGGVHIEVLEEDLRSACAQDTLGRFVVGLDVDGSIGGLFNSLDLGGLSVAAAHAVALAFGSLDDEVDAAVVGNGLVQFEGERGAGADDGGLGRSLHTREGRRSGQDGAAQLHDPEVEALEEVQAGDLALGAQDGLGICAQGSFVPGEDLLVGERLPGGRDHLHHALVLGLVGSSDTAAVATVLDELAALDLRGGNALGAAGHLFKSDGGDVFHSELQFKRVFEMEE